MQINLAALAAAHLLTTIATTNTSRQFLCFSQLDRKHPFEPSARSRGSSFEPLGRVGLITRRDKSLLEFAAIVVVVMFPLRPIVVCRRVSKSSVRLERKSNLTRLCTVRHWKWQNSTRFGSAINDATNKDLPRSEQPDKRVSNCLSPSEPTVLRATHVTFAD